MNKKLLVDLYEKRGSDKEATQKAIDVVENLEVFLEMNNTTFDDVPLPIVKQYINTLVADGNNDLSAFIAIARYFYLIKNNEIYIYFTKLLGGLGVIENIKKRMVTYAGQEITDKIFHELALPKLGSAIEDVPKFTQELINRIEENLEPKIYQKTLAGNNHRIPKASMEVERELYQNSESLETYLKQRHDRKVFELQSYCDSNTVWFEQVITQEVVDYIASNQELLSAVKKGNKLYVTKIPYDIVSFLKENDPTKKSYHACHCPFAREVILDHNNSISSNWCYCSAGFAKFPFEEILGRELDIKLVSSALDGCDICRFEIYLGDN